MTETVTMVYEEVNKTFQTRAHMEAEMEGWDPHWIGKTRVFQYCDDDSHGVGTVVKMEFTDFGPHDSSDGEGDSFQPCEALIEVYFYVERENGQKTEDGNDLWLVNGGTWYVLSA